MPKTKKRTNLFKKSSKKGVSEYKSFKLTKETSKFKSFHFTQQTLYWIILLVYIVVMDLWVFSVQADTLTLFNSLSY